MQYASIWGASVLHPTIALCQIVFWGEKCILRFCVEFLINWKIMIRPIKNRTKNTWVFHVDEEKKFLLIIITWGSLFNLFLVFIKKNSLLYVFLPLSTGKLIWPNPSMKRLQRDYQDQISNTQNADLTLLFHPSYCGHTRESVRKKKINFIL